MKIALQALNDLERAGLIRRYAIGGAMGPTFYLEPFSTFDLDIFVVFHREQPILTLTPSAARRHPRAARPAGGLAAVQITLS